MISAVILNWKRPANVARIVEGWQSSGLVNDPIVWNNNPDSTIKFCSTRVVNTCQDWGLYTRFAAGLLARNDCILWQDDDLELPVESLTRLIDAWKAEPSRVHGVFGRGPRLDGSYAQDFRGNHEVPVVLTRALVASKQNAVNFFQHLRRFEHLQRDTKPLGNGEDIIFSYVAMKESGVPNRVHNVAVKELPAPHAIHARAGHFGHRTKLMRACEAWVYGDEIEQEQLARRMV